MLINKRKIKEQIHDETQMNDFFDKTVNKLPNDALKRAYYSTLKKHKKKNNKNTLYMLNYFKYKCEERGIKV